MIRILTWNVRRANSESGIWDLIKKIDPDICLLQEVNGIPLSFMKEYNIIQHKAINKIGSKQKFSTVILSKEPINEFKLKSSIEWVKKELDFFCGNFIGGTISVKGVRINVVSVYSPAWIVSPERINNSEINEVKLKLAAYVWPTEILQNALLHELISIENHWIVGGDFNTSSTFDTLWPGGPRGCQEMIDRLYSLNLKEALFEYHGKLVPTFKNPKGGKIIHQIDHVFLSEGLFSKLSSSNVLDNEGVFENSLSDHLPIQVSINLSI